jgi:hypothetical protein
MEIEKNKNGHDLLFVHRATAAQLAKLLNPLVPYVWILGHMPNRVVEWWETEVPVNANQKICGQIRMLTYDMQLRTEEFLAHGVRLTIMALSSYSRQRKCRTHSIFPEYLRFSKMQF